MRWTLLFVLLSGSLWAQDIARLKDQKPFEIHSGLSLSVLGYQVSNISPQQPGLSWYLNGSPVVKIYGVSFPFYFLLSNQHRSIQQPFNEFGLSPSYRWAKLHLGYFNPLYSEFTLAGKRIFGTGVELHPGKLRFAASYGRFRKPIQFENNLGAETTFLLPFSEPSYKQTGYAFKLGFGSTQNYIDLVYLKGNDVPEPELFPVDSIAPPQENAVFGLKFRVQPAKWLTWQGDLGVSAYTRDQDSDALPEESIPVQNLVSRILEPKASSQVFSAAKSVLTVESPKVAVSLQYQRVDPDYKSMGAYFFLTDLTSYTVAPRVLLGEGKYSFSGSFGLQSDNLYGQKGATTRRLIGSAQMVLQPNSGFGLVAQFSNYGLNQTALNPNLQDTIVLAQVSRQFFISPRFSWGEGLRHTIQPNYHSFSLLGLQDDLGTITSWNAALQYQLQQASKGWRIQIQGLMRNSETAVGIVRSTGGTIGWQQSFWQNKFRAFLNSGFFLNKNQATTEATGNLLTAQARMTYRLFKNQQIQLQYSFRRNRAPLASLGNDFTENRGSLIYSLQF